MAQMMSRDDIAKTAEKGRWKDVTMCSEKGLSKPCPTTSVVISYSRNATATKKDGKPHHAFVSSGYAHRPGGWKLAFHQQTKDLNLFAEGAPLEWRTA